ncbi:MAG: aminoacyl-tRNA hydrolase [Gammaproteobacteria bacterium]|nr:aminoacyl-tRNA hydrolase [Gammaproteobacteria bacterium]NND35887.1 aminoacyl-tRNA hydrolase [Gammaproteobacteria bacterium]
MAATPVLIVGLGNPGPDHDRDRHNAGYWMIEDIAAGLGGNFTNDQKLHGESCQVSLGGQSVRLLKPTAFMNHSGQSVRLAMDYYKIPLERVLVIHDELDLPPGQARLKLGGGHGGHNGIRDVIAHCGRDFLRLRIGIGHPGTKEQVVGYVLRPPGKDELPKIEDALRETRRALDILMQDGLEPAQKFLHTATPPVDVTQDL